MGQSLVAQSLQRALAGGQVGHACLLAGTRGVGKTSLARILARAIRCQAPLEDRPGADACLRCKACLQSDLDIVEIDGASHNSVQQARELMATTQYLPITGDYRVYIIDEAHMLSTSAFNALLKTLESPPAHIKFILATTAPDKLIDTVLSRCVRYDLRPLDRGEIEAHLKDLCAKEGLSLGEEALYLMAVQARGSLRDALSLLERARSCPENLEEALGLVAPGQANLLAKKVLEGDSEGVGPLFNALTQKGLSLEALARSLLDELSHVALEGPGDADAFWVYETLAKDFPWALGSLSPRQAMEVALKKVALRKTFFPPGRRASS